MIVVCLYLKFINENKDTWRYWSNLWKMIKYCGCDNVFKENNEVIFKVAHGNTNGSWITKSQITCRKDILQKYLENYIGTTVGYGKRSCTWKLNNECINHLNLLIELLEIYLSYIDHLDFGDNGGQTESNSIDVVENLSGADVKFNYTNTSVSIGTEERTHFYTWSNWFR